MSTKVESRVEVAAPESQLYREVSKAAVASVILAALSLAGFPFAPLLSLALLGLILGAVGWRNIRRFPQELSGRIPALAGMVLSGLVLAGGTAMHAVIYATEVPEGYTRISFRELQPNKPTLENPIPQAALELDGKKVFVKGYVHPTSVMGVAPTRRFVLVPDMGTCCFGGQPALTDMIQVTLVGEDLIQYSRRRRKLAGVLKVDKQLKPVSGLDGVYYQLEADYVK